MSIKDRISAANDNATDDDDVDELDDLDDVMAGFDTLDTGEPKPMWEDDELPEDDEAEAEIEDKGGKKKPIPVKDDEDDDSSATDDDDDSESAAAEETVETGDEPTEESDSAEPTTALDTLAALGIDTAGMTESQAVAVISSEYQQIAGQWGTVQDNARIGQEMRNDYDAFKAWKAGQHQTPTPEKKQETPKPKAKAADLLAEIQSTFSGTGEEPENDPMWGGYVAARQITFDGNFYTAAPTHPHLAGIADKLNRHREWERKQLTTALKTPQILAKLAEAVLQEDKQEGGLTMEQVDSHLKTQRDIDDEAKFVSETMQRNSVWMFKHGRDGKPLKSPVTGKPIPTAEGLAYVKELAALQRAGMTDSRKQHFYAIAAISDMLAKKSLAGGKETKQTDANDGGSASSAANSKVKPGEGNPAGKSPADRRVELLKQKKKQAAHAGNQPPAAKRGVGGDDEFVPGKSKPRSVGEIMTEEFMKAGLMKKKPKGDDE